MRKFAVVLILTLSLFANGAAEVAQTFSLDGRLYQSAAAGAPALLDSGTMKVQIINPAATCILYEESQAFDTTTTDGYFNLSVGSNTGAVKRTASDSGNGMATVFSNTIITGITGKLTADGTTACTYTPANGDIRYVRVKVTPVSDGLTRVLSPDLTLNSAAQAVVAERAESLQGYSASSFLRTGTGSTSQVNVDNVFSAINYPRLTDLLSVGTGTYVRESANGAALAPTVAGNASAYLTLPVPVHPVLVLSGGAMKVFGTFPFHEAAFVGGLGTLRSLTAQRYLGDASEYGSVELRVPVARFAFVLPWNVGVFGVVDAGRVFVRGDSPGGWHASRGVGFWINVLDTKAARVCLRPGGKLC